MRGFFMYPGPESNRYFHHWKLDFKSNASTYSATRAGTMFSVKCLGLSSGTLFKIQN
jgi:hypothetical protein